MSILKEKRESQNLTQEELAKLAGVSVRTIQRIEAGTPPKGYTLKALAGALGLEEKEFMEKKDAEDLNSVSLPKVINLSSIPFIVFPPLNIVLPLLITLFKKEFNRLTNQIITVQIIWTIAAVIIFMFSAFMKNWFNLSNKFNLVVMIVLVLTNVFIIIRNAIELDRKGMLYFAFNFRLL